MTPGPQPRSSRVPRGGRGQGARARAPFRERLLSSLACAWASQPPGASSRAGERGKVLTRLRARDQRESSSWEDAELRCNDDIGVGIRL